MGWPRKEFWAEAGWRALRTWCQTALAAAGGTSLDLFHANLVGIASVSTGAAVLSLLMSIDRMTGDKPTQAVPQQAAFFTATAPPRGGCGNNLR